MSTSADRDPSESGFRDPRYAPPALDVERRADGSILLANPRPYDTTFSTMTAALEHWAAEAPERTWLAERAGDGWRELSYAEGWALVRAAAAGLARLGLQRGAAVMIPSPNSIHHAVVAYGAMAGGFVAAPVSPQYAAAGADPVRLQRAAALLRPAAVFVEDALESRDALAGLMAGPVIASRNAAAGDVSFEQLVSGPADAPLGADPGATAKLMLTSGSTGPPKAVVITHANVSLNGAQIAACFEDSEPPVTVNSAPWSHSLGGNALLHGTLHRGGTFYIDRGQPTPERFGETIDALKQISPTYHNMVPVGWTLLADALERDEALARTFFARVRVLQYGGAGLAQTTVDRVLAVAARVAGERVTFAAGYGATETGPTICNVHWLNARTGLLGLPVPGTVVKLAPEGPKFELRVKGPQVSPGYLDDPERSAAAFDEEGFYRLGDAVRFADPERPEAGLVFDGRLVENFKLATGAFVAAGALRVAAVSAIGGAARDAIVCGEGRDGVGLLLFLNPSFRGGLPAADAREAVRAGIERLNAGAKGSAGRVARALILEGAPDPASGEITDKGYINQGLARARRGAEIARLFAAAPDPEVLCFQPL
jgi:feruloyl-CoA synthase